MNEILYGELVKLAKNKKLAAYSDVAPLVGLSMNVDSHRDEIARLLGEIVRMNIRIIALCLLLLLSTKAMTTILERGSSQ